MTNFTYGNKRHRIISRHHRPVPEKDLPHEVRIKIKIYSSFVIYFSHILHSARPATFAFFKIIFIYLDVIWSRWTVRFRFKISVCITTPSHLHNSQLVTVSSQPYISFYFYLNYFLLLYNSSSCLSLRRDRTVLWVVYLF